MSANSASIPKKVSESLMRDMRGKPVEVSGAEIAFDRPVAEILREQAMELMDIVNKPEFFDKTDHTQYEKSQLTEWQRLFPVLYMRSPTLFFRILAHKIERTILLQMLDAFRLQETGSLTEHDASVRFGQVLHNRYFPQFK
jgi:hypothetical protein